MRDDAPVMPCRGSAARMWTVIVPIKNTKRAKSRFNVAEGERAALALALATDTVLAALACNAVGEVIVVTDDNDLPRWLPDTVRFVPDPDAGLNAAIAAGAAAASLHWRAALLGDLPALTPVDLGEALHMACGVPRGVVADAEGIGSTLVTASADVHWESMFGPGSFAAHQRMGCVAMNVPAQSSLRRDVDTAAGLAHAAELGLGVHTAAWHTSYRAA
ncbi:2-phospho-L-lactate guanylyltransferase [Microbacterium sp. CH12i]|uniref:2-phospho-L-lactate guanylyltransferase n=1 Tax=Microbacterium sp. CH12i TaxID=1479651 RepID=UPI001F2C60A9|nr:2-phospho-L-lactate guanylyltransferase [Microbacterium sp. CH12i]